MSQAVVYLPTPNAGCSSTRTGIRPESAPRDLVAPVHDRVDEPDRLHHRVHDAQSRRSSSRPSRPRAVRGPVVRDDDHLARRARRRTSRGAGLPVPRERGHRDRELERRGRGEARPRVPGGAAAARQALDVERRPSPECPRDERPEPAREHADPLARARRAVAPPRAARTRRGRRRTSSRRRRAIVVTRTLDVSQRERHAEPEAAARAAARRERRARARRVDDDAPRSRRRAPAHDAVRHLRRRRLLDRGRRQRRRLRRRSERSRSGHRLGSCARRPASQRRSLRTSTWTRSSPRSRSSRIPRSASSRSSSAAIRRGAASCRRRTTSRARFGIHSAMSSAEARRRCPHAVFLRPRHALYRQYSRAVWDTVAEIVPRDRAHGDRRGLPRPRDRRDGLLAGARGRLGDPDLGARDDEPDLLARRLDLEGRLQDRVRPAEAGRDHRRAARAARRASSRRCRPAAARRRAARGGAARASGHRHDRRARRARRHELKAVLPGLGRHPPPRPRARHRPARPRARAGAGLGLGGGHVREGRLRAGASCTPRSGGSPSSSRQRLEELGPLRPHRDREAALRRLLDPHALDDALRGRSTRRRSSARSPAGSSTAASRDRPGRAPPRRRRRLRRSRRYRQLTLDEA